MSKVKDTDKQPTSAAMAQLLDKGNVELKANSRDALQAEFMELKKASPSGVTLAAGAVGRSHVGGIYTLQVTIV